MEIVSFEIRNSEKVLLSIALGASVGLWVYTWYRNRAALQESVESAYEQVFGIARSPISPRTKNALPKTECCCKNIESKDECHLTSAERDNLASFEEETDTDGEFTSITSASAVMSASIISLAVPPPTPPNVPEESTKSSTISEAPKTEEPKTEEPKTEEPKTEEPKTEEPPKEK